MVGGEIHLEVHGTYVDCGIFPEIGLKHVFGANRCWRESTGPRGICWQDLISSLFYTSYILYIVFLRLGTRGHR